MTDAGATNLLSPAAAEAAYSAAALDLSSPEILNALQNAPTYEKYLNVHARPAKAGELIITILADGSVETSNIAQDGDMVITNPSGEEYLSRGDIFPLTYSATSQPGIYQAAGMVRAFPNPTGGNIEVEAPWGIQFGDTNCLITARFDPLTPSELGPGRIIALREFEETYRPTSQL